MFKGPEGLQPSLRVVLGEIVGEAVGKIRNPRYRLVEALDQAGGSMRLDGLTGLLRKYRWEINNIVLPVAASVISALIVVAVRERVEGESGKKRHGNG